MFYASSFVFLWESCVSASVRVVCSSLMCVLFLWLFLFYLFVLAYYGHFLFYLILLLFFFGACLLSKERQKECGYRWGERRRGPQRSWEGMP